MKLLCQTLGLLVTLLLCVSCNKEDSYVYPSVLTELVEAHIASTEKVDYILTDKGKKLSVANPLTAEKLTTDTLYRTLCMYSLPIDGSNDVRVYSMKLVYAAKPIPKEAFKGEVLTHPLTVQSIWRGGNYLNLLTLPKAQHIPHDFDFIEEGIDRSQGHTRLHLRLHHNQNADLEAYEQKTYLSVPLAHYALQPGDTICFTANTYNRGLHTWKVAY